MFLEEGRQRIDFDSRTNIGHPCLDSQHVFSARKARGPSKLKKLQVSNGLSCSEEATEAAYGGLALLRFKIAGKNIREIPKSAFIGDYGCRYCVHLSSPRALDEGSAKIRRRMNSSPRLLLFLVSSGVVTDLKQLVTAKTKCRRNPNSLNGLHV